MMAGGVAALVCAIGLVMNPAQFVRSFLPAYMWILGITLGSLGLAMIHQVSGGAWGVVIRRILGAATRTLPLLTILFLPIAIGLHSLYPWADAGHVAGDPILQWKQPYLNVPFFLARAAFYFVVWNAIAFFLNKWSVEQDVTADPTIPKKMQLLSAGGLLAYGLTITFAAFDWFMSLEPHWFSTIYGVLFMGGQALAAMAFSILVLAWLVRRKPFDELITADHFHDLGNLMMGFTMLWTYFGFSQYLITWAANIPEETEWYLHRTGHGWQYIALTHRGLSFCRAVPRAAAPRDQAQRRDGVEGGGAHRSDAVRGPVLAERTGVLGGRRSSRALARRRRADRARAHLAWRISFLNSAAARCCRCTTPSSVRH